MYLPMLRKLATQRNLRLSSAVRPVCPWMRGIQYAGSGPPCRAAQGDWYDGVVDELDPDVVIVAHRAIDDPRSPARIVDEDRGMVELDGAEFIEAIAERTGASVDELSAGGRKVVMIEPVPVAPRGDDPLLCLSEATYLDECRFVTSNGPSRLERVDRAVADERDNVWSLDFDIQVCPYLPICDPIVGGLIVRRDPTHISTVFSGTLTPAFARFLDDNGVLD
jgi:hypothetical protein